MLLGADPRPPHAAADPLTPAGAATWQWELRATDGGRRTRLLARQRLRYAGRGAAVLWHLVEPIAFVMERRMLLGIKRRVERSGRPGSGGR